MRSARPRSPRVFTLLLAALFLLGAASSSFAQAPQGRRANARKLLRIADGASLRLIQAGQGKLDRNVRSRAFWEALLHMDAQIDRVGAGLQTRDLSFFQALRTGTASLAELQVTWALAGLQDPVLDQNLRTLSAAYGRLRQRYGPEWVRYQTGRPLSEDERVRFARMRAEQGVLAERIEPLRARAALAGDHATLDELNLLLAQIHAVATASPTLGDYLDASVATDSIRGAWHGARASHDVHEEGWAEADQVVSDITTDEGVGFVFTTDLSSVRDWSFVEEETEIPLEIAHVDARDGEEMAPGRIVDLGGPEETEPAEDLSDSPDVETVLILDETPIEEDLPAEEDLGTEPVSEDETIGDEAIDEEDLDVESPPQDAEQDGEQNGATVLEPCPAGSPECGDDTHLEDLPLEEAPLDEVPAPVPPPAVSPIG